MMRTSAAAPHGTIRGPSPRRLLAPWIVLAVTLALGGPVGAAPPAWVAQPPGGHESESVVVHAGPFAERQDCKRDLQQQLLAATRAYLDANPTAGETGGLEVPLDFIEQYLVAGRYETVQKRSFGPLAENQPMFEMYALLRFGSAAQAHLQQLRRQAVVYRRLWAAGAGLAVVLLILSIAWVLLRRTAADDRRRGKITQPLLSGGGD